MKFKKIYTLLFVSIIFCIFLVITSFATEGTVFRVDIPNANGGYTSLYGEEAKLWYEDCKIETEKELNEIKNIEEKNKNNIDSPLRGPFSYKYRYVEDKHEKEVRREDLKRIITNKLENRSSIKQSYSLSFKVSQGFEINSSISGKYKDAVLSYLGSSWNKSYEKSETFNVDIPPHKRVWIEFVPIMEKSTGKAQKYYKIRSSGTPGRTIIENSIDVTTYSPKYTECKVGNKYIKTVYGAYIWQENSL